METFCKTFFQNYFGMDIDISFMKYYMSIWFREM